MDIKRITSPFSEFTVRSLHIGDSVLLSGTIITARDAAHKHLASAGESPVSMKGMVIYHCGPVTVKTGNLWRVMAAGPTTSIREEPYEADIIEKFRPAAIMGKGGMGRHTLEAMRKSGCVYLNATGGAAAYLAERISSVKDVFFLDEFGQPEAMWVLDVTDFPAIVTMDSFGKSLHDEIEIISRKSMEKLLNNKTKHD